jgi:hypothetical protein
MTPDLAAAGQNALEQAPTYPAHGYVGDVLYLFAVQGGALVARPCVGSGALGDPVGETPVKENDGLSDRAEVLISSAPFDDVADQLRYVLSRYDTTLPPQDVEILRARYNRAIGRHAYTHRAEGTGTGDGDLLPFLPSGLTRALGVPPPEAAKLLNALGYTASLAGVRAFQVAQNIPSTGVVDTATMVALHAAMSVAGLSGDPPRPEPTGTPVYEIGAQVIGQVLRAASREFDREIASVKSSGIGEPPGIGDLSDPPALGEPWQPDPTPALGEPWQPDPTGTSVKSLETPGYLRDAPEEPPPVT